MTPLPRNWREYWQAAGNDGYDSAANSRDCYAAAIAAIRLRLVRDGDALAHENEQVGLMTLWAMR